MKHLLVATLASASLSILASAHVNGNAFAPTPAQASVQQDTGRVSLEVSNSSPDVGSKIRLIGRVRSASVGTRVVLQVRFLSGDAHTWRATDSTLTRPGGRFSFRQTMRTDRSRNYRVRVRLEGRRGASTSSVARVYVYRWLSLQSPAGSGLEPGVASIGGTTYPDSLLSPTGATGGDGSTQTDDTCSTLRATLGLDDTSGPADGATVTVDNQTFAVVSGQPQPVMIDISGHTAFLTSFADPGPGRIALGTPEIRCHLDAPDDTFWQGQERNG